jgi:hypothetical protein
LLELLIEAEEPAVLLELAVLSVEVAPIDFVLLVVEVVTDPSADKLGRLFIVKDDEGKGIGLRLILDPNEVFASSMLSYVSATGTVQSYLSCRNWDSQYFSLTTFV